LRSNHRHRSPPRPPRRRQKEKAKVQAKAERASRPKRKLPPRKPPKKDNRRSSPPKACRRVPQHRAAAEARAVEDNPKRAPASTRAVTTPHPLPETPIRSPAPINAAAAHRKKRRSRSLHGKTRPTSARRKPHWNKAPPS